MGLFNKRSWRFWWQRRTRGWDDSELWNLDDTIAKFILPRLKAFRKNLSGYPGEFAKDYGDGTGIKSWEDILDKMIYSFEAVTNDYNSDKWFNVKYPILPDFDDDGPLKSREEYKKDLSQHLDDIRSHYDRVGHKEDQKRIDEGLRLFGEYYGALWN